MFVASAQQGGVVFAEPEMHIHEEFGIFLAVGWIYSFEVGQAACFEKASELEGEGTLALLVVDHILAVTQTLQPIAVFGRYGQFDNFLHLDIYERVPLLVLSHAGRLEEFSQHSLGILPWTYSLTVGAVVED